MEQDSSSGLAQRKMQMKSYHEVKQNNAVSAEKTKIF